MKRCLVLFSGGTDSCCSVFLCAEKFSDIDLITFYERSTRGSPLPIENVCKLKKHLPRVKFHHYKGNTDNLVRFLSYEKFFKNLHKHGFGLLATPGFSSLSWHIFSILYCLENKIQNIFDGMTQELQHLPGHMPEVRALFTALYTKYNLVFLSPVYQWPVPRDRQYFEQYIVNRHNRFDDSVEESFTTGSYLYKKKFFDNPNIKGSQLDFEMQHACYPFIIYNMSLFWLLIPMFGETKTKDRLVRLFSDKCVVAEEIINRAIDDKKFRNELIGPNQLEIL